MEIERIGENTVKLTISHVDMEERGFKREDVYFNRDVGEELFWEIVEEAEVEEEFLEDSPLWIQIHVLDYGVEMFITRYSGVEKNEQGQLTIDLEELINNEADRIEEILNEHSAKADVKKDSPLEFVLSFAEFEDLIQLSKNQNLEQIKTTLFSFNNKYYLQVKFDGEKYHDDKLIEDALSSLLEYSVESNMTVPSLEEYGKQVMKEDVFHTVNKYFS